MLLLLFHIIFLHSVPWSAGLLSKGSRWRQSLLVSCFLSLIGFMFPIFRFTFGPLSEIRAKYALLESELRLCSFKFCHCCLANNVLVCKTVECVLALGRHSAESGLHSCLKEK